jgi:hypothetical protein
LGQLAFVLPHKFFNAQYGEPLRGLLADGKNLRHVIHFGDQQIFPGATNYVCLLFLTKSATENLNFVRADDLKLWMASEQGVSAKFSAKEIGKSEWNFPVGKGAELFERLQRTPVKLGDAADRMSQGPITSADTVYLFKEFKPAKKGLLEVVSKELRESLLIEEGILKRVVRSGSIGRYHAETTAMVLFPYEVKKNQARLYTASEMENNFPLAWNYLLKNKNLLERREHGSFEDKEWYRFGRTQNLGMWEQPKVLVPYMITDLGAYLDMADNFYFINVTTGGYGITTSGEHGSLAYLCALLNSAPLNFCFKRVSTNFHGGYFAANKQFIEQLPIPNSDETQRRIIEGLVEHLIWLHRLPSVTQPDRNHPQDPQIASYLEQTVNALVYELFFQHELHVAGLRFFELAASLPAPATTPSDTAVRLDSLRKLYTKWSAPGHPLRIALDKLQTLDLVRIIEGHA